MAGFLLLLALAQAPSPEGHWEGAIQLPGTSLAILVDLRAGAGEITIPSQNLKGFALANVRAEGDDVSFAMPGIPGDPAFQGKLSADGRKLEGTFTQGGAAFPFALARRTGLEPLEGLREFVEPLLKEWNVPGVAVAVARGGRVLLAEGFGLRDVKGNLPVTGKTLFAIGSATKAFTATLLQMLVEEGRLRWDDPVLAVLPEFRLFDASAAARITPRDLCSHLSGLPRHDLAWYGSPFTRQELFDRLRYLEPTADLRERFQYQNLMFLVAGRVAERIEGKSYEEILRSRIFGPLGMQSTVSSAGEAQKSADFAKPYAENEGVLREIPFRDATNVAPAGAIHSSAADLGLWVAANLGGGLVSEGGRRELFRPRVALPARGGDPRVLQPSYALGWMVDVYRGKERVHHGGAIDGFVAQVTLFPSEGLGIAVLCNRHGATLPTLLANHLSDRMLGLEPVDWSATLKGGADHRTEMAAAARRNQELGRKAGTSPSRPPAEFAGEYVHPAYGPLVVTPGMKATLHGLTSSLEHWHFDVFAATPEDPLLGGQRILCRFTSDVEGRIDGVAVALEPESGEVLFRRRPPARLSDPAFLGTLAGEYALEGAPDFVVRISLRAGRLFAEAPGQAPLPLEPHLETEFRAAGHRGYGVRFLEEGKSILLLQPEGMFKARRK